MRYSTIPVNVTAMQWEPTDPTKVAEMVSWLIFGGAGVAQVLGPNGFNRLAIGPLGDQMYVDRGDWVVMYQPGVFKPCPQADFATRFEPIPPLPAQEPAPPITKGR